MLQQGQVFKLKGGADETSCWAYRYRVGGRGSRRVQRGGFASERDASEALERALERVRRERGCGTALTLAELVDEYLAQHDGESETIEKLRWLLESHFSSHFEDVSQARWVGHLPDPWRGAAWWTQPVTCDGSQPEKGCGSPRD